MRHNFATLLTVAACSISFSLPASAATDPEICEIRAAILGSVAQERDKGVSKEKVKKMFQTKFGKRFAGFASYVDLVYDQMKDMSPNEVAAFTKFACARE